MRIFINSADTSVVQSALRSGFVYGVTTNPTILRQAGVYIRQIPSIVQQMIDWGAREVHLQTYSETASEIVTEGRMLAAIDSERIVVRVPATPAGYTAAGQLTTHGIQVELVAVYTLRQVLAAEGVGASYVAVYLGRMHDTGVDELKKIGEMKQLLAAQHSQIKILAGSVRDVLQVETLGMQGIPAVTIPATIIDQLLESPATAAAAASFRADAETIRDQMGGLGGH